MDASRIKALAVEILNEIDGSGGSVADRVPEKDVGQLPVWDANDLCAEDYWVEGRVGCLKGARHKVYSQFYPTITTMLAGAGIPLHMSVCIPGDALGDCNSTAADVGFMNRDDFVYVATDGRAANLARWYRCGCPHWTSDGRKWAGGEPSNEKQWDEFYARLKEQGRT